MYDPSNTIFIFDFHEFIISSEFHLAEHSPNPTATIGQSLQVNSEIMPHRGEAKSKLVLFGDLKG